MVICQLLLRIFWIQTWFCNCQHYLRLFYTVFEDIQVHMIKKRFWFSQINFFVEYFPHRINIYCFFPVKLMSSTYTDKNNPFSQCTERDIPNLELSPSHASIGFSQIAFPIIVLLKDDHTDFVQEERLGLPYFTMILAICVVVDESKCLDIPILEFSIISEHLPFLPGCQQILRLLCIVLQCYPQNNIVCIHMYDECKKSIDSGVCHMLWSILWWIDRASLFTDH